MKDIVELHPVGCARLLGAVIGQTLTKKVAACETTAWIKSTQALLDGKLVDMFSSVYDIHPEKVKAKIRQKLNEVIAKSYERSKNRRNGNEEL